MQDDWKPAYQSWKADQQKYEDRLRAIYEECNGNVGQVLAKVSMEFKMTMGQAAIATEFLYRGKK